MKLSTRVLDFIRSMTRRYFHPMNKNLTFAPVLKLLDYNITFELECEASHLGIGAVLIQDE